MRRRKIEPVFQLFGLLGLLVFYGSGCQLETAGSTRKSFEVAHALEALKVYPGYRYYYLNQENEPYGVAGLAAGFWIRDPAWRELDPASPTFAKVVGLVKRFPVPGGLTEGFVILDPGRNEIGVWYSSLMAGITVDPETRQVVIATSTPWLGK
jgi:hypothetical protein